MWLNKIEDALQNSWYNKATNMVFFYFNSTYSRSQYDGYWTQCIQSLIRSTLMTPLVFQFLQSCHFNKFYTIFSPLIIPVWARWIFTLDSLSTSTDLLPVFSSPLFSNMRFKSTTLSSDIFFPVLSIFSSEEKGRWWLQRIWCHHVANSNCTNSMGVVLTFEKEG